MERYQRSLRDIDSTADQIKKCTRAALQLSGRETEVAQTWLNESVAARERDDPLLPYLFAVNDILQESRHIGSKSTLRLLSEFEKVLVRGIALLSEDYSILGQITNVVHIWKGRKVLSSRCLDELLVEIGDREEGGESNSLAAATTNKASEAHQQPQVNEADMRAALANLPVSRLLSMQVEAKQSCEKTKMALDSSAVAIASTASENMLKGMEEEELVGLLAQVDRAQTSLGKRKEALGQVSEIQAALINALEDQIGKQQTEVSNAALDMSALEASQERLVRLSDQFSGTENANENGDLVAEFVRMTKTHRKKRLTDTPTNVPDDKPKKDQPMAYDKFLKRYVPLPSIDDTDSWRDR